jgi:phosphomannomutase
MPCFKAYDVRGTVPETFNAHMAYRIGRALVAFLGAGDIVIGRDLRYSGLVLEAAFCQGVMDAGANALCLGICTTEEVYCATALSGAAGGAMLTASHNPISDNGIKMVRKDACPISAESGLFEIRDLAQNGHFPQPKTRGVIRHVDYRRQYVQRLMSFVEPAKLRPLHIVSNVGNTTAGLVLDLLTDQLPFKWTRLDDFPDGRFPKGVPNPMLEEHRKATGEAIQRHGADMGIAWDGDCDRCFFFDERGEFVEGYYLVGLLAEHFLSTEEGNASAIVHDARLVWHTQDVVQRLGGKAVCSPAGHSYIKDAMRKHDAIYGGEMSAHHYFRDFFYCDSGMVPWLVLTQLLSERGQKLSSLLSTSRTNFPVSGEINCAINGDGQRLLDKIATDYGAEADRLEREDGVSVYYPDWRFNVRLSNTEPLVRLNVETRADSVLLERKTVELRRAISN